MIQRHGKILSCLLGAAILAVLIVLPLSLNRYGLYIFSMWAVMSIAAIGLNLTLGYAGQVSLAQGAFVGIGAYTGAILTTNGMPLIVALIAAIVLCFAIGWLLGYPALRVQHHYLAFVTLAFSTLAFLVFRNEEWLTKASTASSASRAPVSSAGSSLRRCSSIISALPRWRSSRPPRGGWCARPGAAPSWPCARTRCARNRWASTRAATR